MLSLVLATAMLVGGSMTAFAAPTSTVIEDLPMSEGDGKIVMDATVQSATIKVTVTYDGSIIANPYGLSIATVDVDGENTLEGATSTSATSMWTDDDAFTVTTTYDLKMAKTPFPIIGKGVKESASCRKSRFEEEITVLASEFPISVSVPSEVKLTIDPWKGSEQIYSEVFAIENKGGCDIVATLDNVRLTVNRDNAEEDVPQKDCNLYLSGDIPEDIALPEGDSGELLCVRIPAKKEGESLKLRVYGRISGGSEMLWRNGDINLKFSFEYAVAEKK